MGLSRNKVAVSEGAAGSPPFYGDRDRAHENMRLDRSREVEQNQKDGERVGSAQEDCGGLFCLLFNFE